MANTKYKFNPESLSFDRISLGVKAILLRLLAYFIGSVLIAIVYSLVFALFIDSPKEKALKREIAQLSLQYELINREMGNIEKVVDHLEETDDNLYRTIFGAEPIPATLRDGGVGGVNRYNELEGFNNSKQPNGLTGYEKRSISSHDHSMILLCLQKKKKICSGQYLQLFLSQQRTLQGSLQDSD